MAMKTNLKVVRWYQNIASYLHSECIAVIFHLSLWVCACVFVEYNYAKEQFPRCWFSSTNPVTLTGLLAALPWPLHNDLSCLCMHASCSPLKLYLLLPFASLLCSGYTQQTTSAVCFERIQAASFSF